MRTIYPIIVIGQPRSGTSNVARILHEHFGVFMGHKFWKPGFAGTDGTYEDLRLMEANSLFEYGFIKLKPWMRRFRRFVRAREKLDQPWGFKDPRLIRLLSVALTFFDSPTIIRCKRAERLVVKSQMEKLGWSEEKALNYASISEKTLDQALVGRTYLLLHYPEDGRYRTQQIIDELSQIEFSYDIS